MNDKILSLLGMARRAGKLALGHDAVISDIVKNKAKLVIISSEGSERLRREISHACTYNEKNIPVIYTSYTTAALSAAVGSKAAVMALSDEGFAKAVKENYSSLEGRKE